MISIESNAGVLTGAAPVYHRQNVEPIGSANEPVRTFAVRLLQVAVCENYRWLLNHQQSNVLARSQSLRDAVKLFQSCILSLT